MARVTVEECILRIPNRFELVMVAAQRTRQLAAGAEPMVPLDNDKFPVVSLREIEEDKIDHQKLIDNMSDLYRRPVQFDHSDEMAEHISEEMQVVATTYGTNLSLTGEIDAEEAALEAEFAVLEKNIV